MSSPAVLEPVSNAAPEDVLRWAYETFPRVAIVASFQAESSVLIDIAWGIQRDVTVLTLDTGRLPQATHDMIDRIRDRYSIDVQVVAPDAAELDRKSTRLNSSHRMPSRMPSSA